MVAYPYPFHLPITSRHFVEWPMIHLKKSHCVYFYCQGDTCPADPSMWAGNATQKKIPLCQKHICPLSQFRSGGGFSDPREVSKQYNLHNPGMCSYILVIISNSEQSFTLIKTVIFLLTLVPKIMMFLI